MNILLSPTVATQRDGRVRVALEPWEIAVADGVGRGRVEANRNAMDAAHYDRSLMQDDIIAATAAAACEMATAKALNLYWSPSVWPRSAHARHAAAPDIAPDIEVRRIREDGNPLAVRERDASRNRRMVLAYTDPADALAVVRLIGWCHATAVYAAAIPARYDRSGLTRLVPQERLTAFLPQQPSWDEFAGAAVSS